MRDEKQQERKRAKSVSKGPSPHLVDLVGRLFEAASQGIDGQLERDTAFIGRYAGEQRLASATVQQLADEVLAELGPDHGFQGSWEVVTYCIDRLLDIQDSDPEYDVDDSRVNVAAQCQHPSRRFAMDLSYPCASRLTFDWPLGGPHELRISVTQRKRKPSVVRVRGCVTAATVEGAVLNFERLLDAVFGAFRTVGLATFHESRSPLAKRPLAKLKAVEPRRPLDDLNVPLAAVYGDRLSGLIFRFPSDLSDLERSLLDAGQSEQAIARHRRALTRVLAGTDQRALELRNACRLALNAEHSLDFGVLVSLAFSCLEGLLLLRQVKEEVLARLAEAVAHSLGGPVEEKERLRKRVKKLYEVRSAFTHTGMVGETAGARQEALDLMYRVIRREFSALPEEASKAAAASGR
jgi:hypothetical protein